MTDRMPSAAQIADGYTAARVRARAKVTKMIQEAEAFADAQRTAADHHRIERLTEIDEQLHAAKARLAERLDQQIAKLTREERAAVAARTAREPTMSDVADLAMVEMDRISRHFQRQGRTREDAEAIARSWFDAFVDRQLARLHATKSEAGHAMT